LFVKKCAFIHKKYTKYSLIDYICVVDTLKPVSIRAFAKMVGLSEAGVRRAVSRGDICKGVVDGKIVPAVAAEEWGKPLLAAGTPEPPASEPVVAPGVIDLSKNPAPETLAPDPAGEGHGAGPVDSDLVGTDGLDEDMAVRKFTEKIDPTISKIQAERLISIFKAKKAQRELEILEREYVPAKDVYDNLLLAANIIRDKFIGIPERVVDNVRAADTRAEAVIIIREEVIAVLSTLSRLGEIKLYKE
jgi:hypothetical protein